MIISLSAYKVSHSAVSPYLALLETESMVLCMLDKHSTTEVIPKSNFTFLNFETGSH